MMNLGTHKIDKYHTETMFAARDGSSYTVVLIWYGPAQCRKKETIAVLLHNGTEVLRHTYKGWYESEVIGGQIVQAMHWYHQEILN